MQTSLRYSSDSKSLRIHAKEKIPVDSKIHCQVHGELDTSAGALSSFTLLFRDTYPQISTSVDAGIRFERGHKLRYCLRGKKSFYPIGSKGLLSFNLKGRYNVDDKLKKKETRGAAEFSWSILNFQKDQDVRLKVGYEVFQKVPYLQIRENNWTLNADLNGRWNLRYDL